MRCGQSRVFAVKADDKALKEIAQAAKKFGATDSKIIDTDAIVIDERVRLKCEIPRCSNFNQHLMCPPNLMPVNEFRKVVKMYEKALIVQIEADYDSSDKSDQSLTSELCEELERKYDSSDSEQDLHMLINMLETYAFKKGFYLSVGLIGGECLLCKECVTPHSGQPCRHPFESRPSMEAMSIDVLRTCRNAGLPLKLSSKQKVRWTGLVLLG